MKKLFSILMATLLSFSMVIPTFAATKPRSIPATVTAVKKGSYAKFRLPNGLIITGKYVKNSGKNFPKVKEKYAYTAKSYAVSNGDESVSYNFSALKDSKKYAKFSYNRFHAGKGKGITTAKHVRDSKPVSAIFTVKKPSGGTMQIKAKDITPGVFLPKNGAKYTYSWTTKNRKDGAKKVTYQFTSCKNNKNYLKEANFSGTYTVNYKDLK